MKNAAFWSFISVATLCVGCASPVQHVSGSTNATAYPSAENEAKAFPSQNWKWPGFIAVVEPTGNTKPGQGTLLVYTAPSLSDNNSAGHTGYTLYPNGAGEVRWVSNWALQDQAVESPVPVTLPAGEYQIQAEGKKFGSVIVPAVVEAGKTTSIYLDGKYHPLESLANEDLVTLPDGDVMGWSADTSTR